MFHSFLYSHIFKPSSTWDRVSPAALYLFIQHLLYDSCWPECAGSGGDSTETSINCILWSIYFFFFGHWKRLFAYFIMDPHKIHNVGIISLFQMKKLGVKLLKLLTKTCSQESSLNLNGRAVDLCFLQVFGVKISG